MGVVSDEQQARQQDLGLGEPEVHPTLDPASRRGIAQRSGRTLRADDGSGLLERRPHRRCALGDDRCGRVVDADLSAGRRHPWVVARRSDFTEDRTAGPSHSRMPRDGGRRLAGARRADQGDGTAVAVPKISSGESTTSIRTDRW